MQVSAIFSDGYKIYKPAQTENREQDYINGAFTSYSKNEKKEEDIFKLINEWKAFCHKQIEEGNLDYTA